jgi:hypothetical protein
MSLGVAGKAPCRHRRVNEKDLCRAAKVSLAEAAEGESKSFEPLARQAGDCLEAPSRIDDQSIQLLPFGVDEL